MQSRLKDDPNALTNASIQEIGAHYLDKHNASKQNAFRYFFDRLLHTNHPVAHQLKDYSETNDAFHKWVFLANKYSFLAKSHGELSNDILTLFHTAFGKSVSGYILIDDSKNDPLDFDDDDMTPADYTTALKAMIGEYYAEQLKSEVNLPPSTATTILGHPECLTNGMIQKIGSNYLAAHGDQSGCLGFFKQLAHGHQDIAKELKHYTSESSSYEKWRYLADCYAQLNQSAGELSNAILSLFVSAFGRSIYTAEQVYHPGFRYSSGYYETVYFSPEVVAKGLRGIIGAHYGEAFYNQLHLSNESLVPNNNKTKAALTH